MDTQTNADKSEPTNVDTQTDPVATDDTKLTTDSDTNTNTAISDASDESTLTAPATIPSGDSAEILLNLESLIKSHMVGIDTRKTELKKYKEMINSALENDATYREHAEKAKEAAKLKGATKAQILKMPQNGNIQAKSIELSGEIKDMEGALSDYLREYARMSGTNEIEGDDGEVREIVYIAKLIRKSMRGK
jgi:hypothetical protein